MYDESTVAQRDRRRDFRYTRKVIISMRSYDTIIQTIPAEIFSWAVLALLLLYLRTCSLPHILYLQSAMRNGGVNVGLHRKFGIFSLYIHIV